MSYKQNVTYIEDLPELDDIDVPHAYGNPIRPQTKQNTFSGSGMLPDGEAKKYQQYIRPTSSTHPMAGMTPSASEYQPRTTPIQDEYIQMGEAQDNNNYHPQNKYYLPPGSPSCIDIANHVEMCPICNRYYNTDKTIYIIAIVVLAILCILLLKRVLNA